MPPTSAQTRRFGRYEPVRSLGRGALGEVWLARDPALDRLVAIKTVSGFDALPPEERARARERFLREARAAAALSHPHIVTIHDVAEADGVPFIVMEYIRGVTLDRHTSEGHLLPAAKVLELGIQAALALDEAHRAGLVHRDIKPANLFLQEDGKVKVADFGLAKDPTSALTTDQSLLGTPNYMAPEQIAGKPLDGRADLFSLAVTLYELLTGRRPFPGSSVSSVLYRIVNEPPVPITEVRPDLPESLASVFDKALAKDPDARFPTAAAFAAALKGPLEQLGGVPGDLVLPPPARVAGPTPDAEPAASRPTRRRRRWWPRLAALAAIALAGAVAAWTAPLWSSFDPLGERREPAEDWLSAHLGAFGDALRTRPAALRVPVETDPPGLDWRVVSGPGERDEQGRLVVPAAFEGAVELAVTDRCHEGSVAFRAEELPESIVVKTRPVTVRLTVGSTPPGAEVVVDGESRGTTPVPLELTRCDEHRVVLRARRMTPKQIVLDPEDADGWAAALAAVALSRVPDGTIVVPPADGYRVVVYGARTGRRLARAGEPFTLPPGAYTLVLEAPEVLFRRKIDVRVASGETLRPDVAYPPVGRLDVLAIPPGGGVRARPEGGERFVDLGETPLSGRKLVAGTYEVEVENPLTFSVVRRVVRVPAGDRARVRVRQQDWP